MIEGYEISDAHVHIGTCSLIGAEVDWLDISRFLDRNRLQRILVSPLDVDVLRWNELLPDLFAMEERLYGLARVENHPWLNPDVQRDFVEGLLEKEGMLGVKFHPSFDKAPVTCGAYDEVFDYLEENNLLALIHCGRWREVSNYRFPLEVAENHPDLKVILAHMGGNELALSRGAIEAARGHENVYLDTSNCRIPFVIETAVKELGDRRILLGSDYPWGSLMANIWTVLDSEIPEPSKRRILSLNLEELLEGLR